MTKMKATKRALLSSALALFLCFAMLIGTTFAWFTDSVTSANNIIKSGNLDITLEYYDVEEKMWKDVKGASDILTNSLWEPGVTEVAYFRIKNAGSLALKYQFGVNIVSETEGVNAAGDPFKLSDYIQFGVVENVNGESSAYANREDAIAAVTDAKKISAGYAKADSLMPGDELYLAMVVYMPTTVGNVANHNGTNVPQIDLGINIMATQLASEVDSFDKYYDGATEWYGDLDYSFYEKDATELTVGTAEQLAALATLVNGTATQATMYANVATGAEATVQDSFEGVTITLASDIDLNNIPWTPIGNWDNAFEGTFDGNGYTIRNLYINDPNGEGVGFFGVAANATIKGVTFENVNINGYSMVATVAGAAYPSIISDCHVTGDINIVAEWAYVAGISGYNYYGTQVSDCSVIADADNMGTLTSKTRNAVGGITAWLLEGDHKVTECAVKNLNLTGWTNIGAITGFVHYSNTIADCSVENVVITKTRADGYPGVGLIAGGYSYNANNASILKNNIINGVELNGNYIAYSTYNNLYGSEYGGATDANFVLENNKVENITNKLIEVVKTGTVADLKDTLASGENVVLGGDVTVTKSEAGSNGYGATGIYIGNGQTLDGNDQSLGVNAWSTWDSAINITSGTIKNLTVNSGMRGIFISHNGTAGKVYLENVIVDGTVYTISCDQGTNSGLEAKNSTFNGWTSYAATIGDVKFVDCSFGAGQGYNFSRPYAPTTYVGCDFAAGHRIDARAAVTFENCTIGGEPLTAENLATLVTGGIANATVIK